MSNRPVLLSQQSTAEHDDTTYTFAREQQLHTQWLGLADKIFLEYDRNQDGVVDFEEIVDIGLRLNATVESATFNASRFLQLFHQHPRLGTITYKMFIAWLRQVIQQTHSISKFMHRPDTTFTLGDRSLWWERCLLPRRWSSFERFGTSVCSSY